MSYRLALRDKQRTLLFNFELNGYAVSNKLNKTSSKEDGIIIVRTETIDKLKSSKIDFIKIVVAGFKVKV